MGNFEGRILDRLGNATAADTLGAGVDCLVRAIGGRDVNPLEIWLKLPARNAGDFCTDTAQVFLLTTCGDLIAHLGPLATEITLPSHGDYLFLYRFW